VLLLKAQAAKATAARARYGDAAVDAPLPAEPPEHHGDDDHHAARGGGAAANTAGGAAASAAAADVAEEAALEALCGYNTNCHFGLRVFFENNNIHDLGGTVTIFLFECIFCYFINTNATIP
jgi:hypothetical protein